MSDVTLLLLFVVGILVLWLCLRESFSAETSSYPNYIASLMNQGVPFSRVFSRAAYNTIKTQKNPSETLTELSGLQY